VFLEASYQSRRHGMYHSSITLSWIRVVLTGSLGHCEDRGGLDCGGMERLADSTIASCLPKVKPSLNRLKLSRDQIVTKLSHGFLSTPSFVVTVTPM
jgi:hypothetical protein